MINYFDKIKFKLVGAIFCKRVIIQIIFTKFELDNVVKDQTCSINRSDLTK